MIRTSSLLLLAALGALPASGAGLAVEGRDQARLLPPAGAVVRPYANAGYRLEIVGGEVRIEVETSPLASKAPFRPPASSPRGPVGKLAGALTAGAATEYEAVSRVLGWVARNVAYEVDRRQAQTAEAVLERRSGYCTGIARLSVVMLEAVGLTAREVAGYVLDGSVLAGAGGGPAGGSGGYHRWIEVELSDRGWVFSDPLSSHHFVPASYVRLASEQIAPSEGLEGLMLERHDELRTSDVAPSVVPGVRVRRNTPLRYAAALRVVALGSKSGVAVLEGPKVRLTHVLLGGETTFVGLEPGTYELRVRAGSESWAAHPVDLPERLHKTVLVPTSPAGTAGAAKGAEK